MKNYYKILEVEQDVSDAQLKSAYRSLAKKYHPDKSTSVHATRLFTQVNEAYEVLSDPDQKLLYDQQRNRARNHRTYQPQTAYTSRKPPRSRTHYRPAQNQVDVRPYVKYFKAINAIALVFSILFTVDFLLPRQQQVEQVTGVHSIWGQTRGGVKYRVSTEIITNKGVFRVRKGFQSSISRGSLLNIDRSMFLNIATAISLNTSQQTGKKYLKGNIYYNFSFALIAMLGTSIVSVQKKITPMSRLNFALVNGILFLLVIYFTAVS